jgi:hypothetical protein
MTIDVRARRAERLLVLLALLAVAFAAALLSALSPLPTAAFFVSSAAFVLFGYWRQGWLGGRSRLAAVSWLPDGRWLLTDDCQTGMPAELRADSRIGSRWLWLRWDTDRARRPRCHSMLLLQGDIPADELRRLLVRLRLQSHAARPEFAAEFPARMPGA